MQEAVVRNIHASMPAAKLCYETALRSNPKAAGTVNVRAKLGADGQVSSVEVKSEELDEPFKNCIRSIVLRWRFPPGEATLDFPIVLRAEATTLSRQDIQAGMRRTSASAKACYDRFRVPGTYLVDVTVLGSGLATAIPQGQTSETAQCLCSAVIGTARFPAFNGPAVTFTYPFILR